MFRVGALIQQMIVLAIVSLETSSLLHSIEFVVTVYKRHP